MSTRPGVWEAEVVDNKDPLGRRRLKVRVHTLHETAQEIADVDLPWALPCFPLAGPTYGDDGVPSIGAGVWVIFRQGNPEYPVWLGGWYGTGEGPAEMAVAGAPGAEPKGFYRKTPGGWYIGVDENDGVKKAEIKSPSLYSVSIDEVAKKIEAVTPAGFKVSLDETANKLTIQTPTGDKLELDAASGQGLLKALAKMVVEAVAIEIGQGATQPAVLGTLLKAAFDTHTHPFVGVAPTVPSSTSVPTIPLPPTVLSTKVKVG